MLCSIEIILNKIASYLYGKQIKSKLWTKLYLLMIFICVRLNRLHFHECRPMPLNVEREGADHATIYDKRDDFISIS